MASLFPRPKLRWKCMDTLSSPDYRLPHFQSIKWEEKGEATSVGFLYVWWCLGNSANYMPRIRVDFQVRVVFEVCAKNFNMACMPNILICPACQMILTWSASPTPYAGPRVFSLTPFNLSYCSEGQKLQSSTSQTTHQWTTLCWLLPDISVRSLTIGTIHRQLEWLLRWFIFYTIQVWIASKIFLGESVNSLSLTTHMIEWPEFEWNHVACILHAK